MTTYAALALRAAPCWEPEPLTDRELEELYRRSYPAFRQEQLQVDLEPTIAQEVDYRTTPSHELPDPAALCARIVPAMLEVMGGVRPVSQVSRWFAPGLRSRIAGHHTAALRRGIRPMHAPAVRRVHVCPVGNAAVEVSVVVAHQGRVRACAIRLMGVDGRWLVTALEMA